ncbi:hypothetical protein EJ08DRAFT_729643 [Tothia fuscella]|uniref:Alkyl hydroperoxide reductase subunit C/ Thiol specific antioxidant domain-containing protein n=1 Tax=Tothia fuscella TaxID=1048955 RepID=A0A9P4U3C1_9PEZI|nr:hypothetical protein EJ08DRAFT_729643 [Tothia fuscella]
MTFYQEYSSWWSPPAKRLSPTPSIGQRAPSTARLPLPPPDGRPTIVTFLRHCGCPFAEDSFIQLRNLALQNTPIHFVAISHSSQSSTDGWLRAVGGPGTQNPITVIVDEEREIYAKWGLGISGWMHVLSPGGLYSAYKLGRAKDIWNRPTETGSRWQQAGSWAVDGSGYVKWGGPAQRADDLPNFEDAVRAVQAEQRAKL